MNKPKIYIERDVENNCYEAVIYNENESNLRWWSIYNGTKEQCKDFKENYDKGIEWISKGAK